MGQGKSKSAAEYILRVEDKRLQLNMEEAACYHHFTPLLGEEERMRLDAVRELTVTIGGTTDGLLTWENLVARA